VVVIVTPLERVGAVNLGHVVPEFNDDIVRTVWRAHAPRGGVGKHDDGKVGVAVGIIGYANPLLFPTHRRGRNSVPLRRILIGRIRPVVLPPVVAARVKTVQQSRRDGVVVTEAINVRSVVPRIAAQRNRQAWSAVGAVQILLPRAPEKERDLLLRADYLV